MFGSDDAIGKSTAPFPTGTLEPRMIRDQMTMTFNAGKRVVGATAVIVGFAIVSGPANAQTPRVPAIVAVCAPCHGVKGDGGDVEKPNLAGQKSIYLRLQLLAFRSGKRKHPQMQSVVRSLRDSEIDQLVVYYSTLVP